jgi:predicted nucleic acid-binding protein
VKPKALDSSVLVAAFAEWHEAHPPAHRLLQRQVVAVGHAVAETYSVLTRLPQPHRADAALVAEFLEQAKFGNPLVLDSETTRGLPSELSRLGISGGATYDAVIALTAAAHGATLVSLDQRAAVTYRRCGVRFEMLAS